MRWMLIFSLCLVSAISVFAQNDQNPPHTISGEICTSNLSAFARDDGDGYDVFYFENGGIQNLTQKDDANEYFALFSPDLQQIAFISDRDDDLSEIYLMDPTGENIHQLTDDDLAKGYFSWSLDSRYIIYSGFYDAEVGWYEWVLDPESLTNRAADIFMVDAETGETVQLTNGFAAIIALALNREMSQIAFAADQDGQSGIYILTVESGEIQYVAPLGENEYVTEISWSPDNRYLVFTSRVNEEYRNLLVDIEAGSMTNLYPDTTDYAAAFYGWTADSANIIWVMLTNPLQYEMMNIETGEETPIWEITARAICLENVRTANALLEEMVSTP